MAEQSNNELINYKRRKKRGIVPIVLIISLAIGLLVGAMSFYLSYRYMITDSADEIQSDGFSANGMADQVQANLIGSDIDGVVKEVKKDNNTITFYNIKNDTTTTVTVTDSTKFPKNISFNNVKIGDLYTYVFNEDKQATVLKECKNQWSVEDIGLKVSTSAKMVKFTGTNSKHAGTSYKYVDGLTTVRYKNEYSSLEKISPMDYVKLVGYDKGGINKVYSITIEKSHGELQVQNVNYADDVVIEVNKEKYEINEDNSRIILPEGTQKIKITAENCEPVEKEIVIDPAKAVTIDLSKLMVKAGALDVYTNVDDCKIYIKDKEYTSSETILLAYGTYEVRASKSGYKDAKGTVSIDADNNFIELDLEKEEKTGKVKITAKPDGAEIYIDDKDFGSGTVEREVALGSYIVKAEAEGYKTEKKQLNITAEGQVVEVNFDLKKES